MPIPATDTKSQDPKSVKLKSFIFPFAPLAASALLSTLHAATWNSITSGNFSDTTKWSLGTSPLSNEAVIFSNTTGVTATVDSAWPASGTRQVNSITFNSGVGANTIAAGAGVTSLGMTGTITNNSTNLQIFGSGLQLDIGSGSGRAASGGRLQFDGIVNLNTGATSTFRVNSGQTTTFNAAITGGQSGSNTNFTLSGGIVALNSSNTYNGTTNFDSGTTVNIGASSNLGASAGAVTSDNTRNVITYAGSGIITKGALTLNQTTLGASNTLDLRNTGSGSYEFTGAVTNANSNAAIQMGSAGGRVILSGTFSSSFGIAGRNTSTLTFANTSGTQSTSGILGRLAVNSGNGADDSFNVVRNGVGGTTILSGNNTYTGTTTVTAGTLLVTKAASLSGYTAASKVSVASGATLAVRAGGAGEWASSEVDTLLGATPAAFSSGSNLGIDVTTGNTFSYANNLGATQSAKNFIKSGDGQVTLTGANNYTGATTISGGTLTLGASGSIDNTSSVSLGTVGTFDVSAKGGYTVGTLKGSGNVTGALTVSTQLAIGNSPGTTNFSNNLTLGAGATYLYDLTGGVAPGAADLADVAGTLTITTGSILDLVQLGTYTANNKFTLFAYDGAFSGTFKDTSSNILTDGRLLHGCRRDLED